MLFWKYCKDMKTYFGYCRHTWLHKTKMIVLTCRRLRCLSVCQKNTSLFTFFLEITMLADSILIHNSRPRILPDMGWLVKNQKKKKISFHFRLSPRKSNNKIFQKIQKHIMGPFWILFAQS